MMTRRWIMGLALAIAAMSPVPAVTQGTAIYHCKANDQTVFQDHPCAGTVAETPPSPASKQVFDEAALEHKLDRLQALGVGLIQPSPPSAQQSSPEREPLYPAGSKPMRRMTWGEYQQMQQAWTARLTAQAEHNNAVAAAKLSQDEEHMQQRCGEKLSDLPNVGMSDDAFRLCTALARYGHITQIVVSDEDGIPLRLYVFPTEKIRRVYSINGVVTAVRP